MEYTNPGGFQPQEELAALFARNLTFARDGQPAPAPDVPRGFQDTVADPPAPDMTYSITQHYHHSAHIPQPQPSSSSSDLPVPDELQRPASQPADSLSSDTVLRIHGIDPDKLTPAQIRLFRVAARPQQRRLLELWSIYPPENNADIDSLAWSSSTMEQEEQLARSRHERLQNQSQQHLPMQETPMQAAQGQWSSPQPAAPEPEPYMSSGYEELMRREREREITAQSSRNVYSQATDPVYLGPDFARQQQQVDMATQYGAFEQLRGGQQPDAMDVM